MRANGTTLMIAVYQLNEENTKSATAYVLFYRRVRIDDASISNRARSYAGCEIFSLESRSWACYTSERGELHILECMACMKKRVCQ